MMASVQNDPESFDSTDAHLLPDSQLRMFVVLFRLPFELPLNQNITWSFYLPGDLGHQWDSDIGFMPTQGSKGSFPSNRRHPFASVRVWQPKATGQRIPFEAVQQVAETVFPSYERIDLPDPALTAGLDPYESVVEVVTQLARTTDDPSDRPVADSCFDRCLWAVNRLVLGVANATKDPELHAYAVEELDPFALVASRPIDGGFDVEPMLFALHLRLPFPRKLMTDDDYERLRASMSLDAQGQPFLDYARLMRAARRAVGIGDYAQSVILSCVGGEVLLNLALRAILVEAGRENEIAAIFSSERSTIKGRLRREYAPLLGGQWNPDRSDGPVGHWVAVTQAVRNRVVHAGHEPSNREAVEASNGADMLEVFLFQRLVDRRYRYPKTVLSVVGEPGLRRRNLWNARMKLVADGLVPTLPAFWRSIRGESAATPAGEPQA